MTFLSAAYHGYSHQDIVTAYALASLLLPRIDIDSVAPEQKAIPGDLFDDLEILGGLKRKIQIKAHQTGKRSLRRSDFTTDAISFRIDKAIKSALENPITGYEFRLFVTYNDLDEDLLPFVLIDKSVPPLLPDLPTQRFRLDIRQIWPDGEKPVWHHLDELGREAFTSFCKQFVIEIGCPQSSGDLRKPGPLEYELLSLLHKRIGIGIWPNDDRNLTDATARAIDLAKTTRIKSETLTYQNIVETLALRVDYGRVEERFPVDEHLLVQRPSILDEVVRSITNNHRLVITGSPGVGKSWLIHLLNTRLSDNNWLVIPHYCYVDMLDTDRTRRASVNTTFGSIIASLLESDPSITSDAVPRYAAGPHELERLLENAVQRDPDLRIAIIVDGLDHADRLLERSHKGRAKDIADEFAFLSIPNRVALVIVSQPGDHLDEFEKVSKGYHLSHWRDQSIRTLINRLDVTASLREASLEHDVKRILHTIVEKAEGNPLYATYLARTAINLAGRNTGVIPSGDIAEYLENIPSLDQNINRYYDWLVESFAEDRGSLWIAELLSLIDFPVSTGELGQIKPDLRHHIDAVLSSLSPILIEEIAHGGFRIYHESFQRYMRDRLASNPEVNVTAILDPVIRWLDARGFYEDIRAFRSLLLMFHRAERNDEVISRITDDFVTTAASFGQPADTIFANISMSGEAAAHNQNWPNLARLVEISRTADYLYKWRLLDHTIAEQYGRAFSSLFGAKLLADRLLQNEQCTFPPRPGLILCQLCDEEGVIPPWRYYLEAYETEQKTDNTSYGDESDSAILAAQLTGQLRLKGRESSIQDSIVWLRSPDNSPFHPGDVAYLLGMMYGKDAIVDVIEALPQGIGRAWARFELAFLHENSDDARCYAENALLDGLPLYGWRSCIKMGVDPNLIPKDSLSLQELTNDVLGSKVQLQDDVLKKWLTALQLSAASGDDAALINTELKIPSDSWFHRWLRFCVIQVSPNTTPDSIVEALHDLSKNIEVFKGDPRVCDLYSLHDDIRGSFQNALSILNDEQWSDALDYLAEINTSTSTWLMGSRSGPLPIDRLSEICLNTADTDAKRLAASKLGTQLLSPERRSGEFYDTHAQDHLLLARLQVAAGERSLAEKTWREACSYLSGYGWRKDITIYELLDPLETMASVDTQRTRRCLHDIQPAIERVLIHTDGKETRHAIHSWIDLAARIHPAGALLYLAQSDIARISIFGSLHHAFPQALVALKDEISPLLNTIGWLAAGPEARSEVGSVLSACEKAIQANPRVGKALWYAILGCMEGDGAAPATGLSELEADSAVRFGLHPPAIEPESKQTSAHAQLDSSSIKPIINFYNPPVFPPSSSPLQIAYGVRQWYASRRNRRAAEHVSNVTGWTLMELIEGGDEYSAITLIQRIARDTPTWEENNILHYLARGLAVRGATSLAALAYTYAYTRSSDGWRRFAGMKSKELFTKALELDPQVTWVTLSEEVAEGISRGGAYGLNVHMIELLAINGRADDAFDAWDAAFRIVINRLPPTGHHDNVEIVFEPDCDTPDKMLAAFIVARINFCTLHEKRLAIAAIALIAHYYPTVYSYAFRFAIENCVPTSTLIALLQILVLFEADSYEITGEVVDDLRNIAESEYVSARVLACELLKRADLSFPTRPPQPVPPMSTISEERKIEIARNIGVRRVETIEKIWPEFGAIAAGRVNTLLESESLTKRMQEALRQLDSVQREHHPPAWLPINEEVEKTLQTTGAAVRTALAQKGIIKPQAELGIGTRLLGEMELSVRYILSRIIRPTSIPYPSSPKVGCQISQPHILAEGEFSDWIIAAHYETELVFEDDYKRSITAEKILYAGIVFVDEWHDDNGLPFGYGYPFVWNSNPPSSIYPVPFMGPLVGMEFVRDSFGTFMILTPHPILSIAGQLKPAAFSQGFTLTDNEGNPAVVCRTWRQRYIDDQYIADQIPTIEGMAILVRPDNFRNVSTLSLEPPKFVTCVSNKQSGSE